MRTALFMTDPSQAARLPRPMAFPPGVREVATIRDGAARIVVPLESTWDGFFEAAGIDLGDRDQPPAQERDTL